VLYHLSSSNTAVRKLGSDLADGAPPGFPGVWDGSDGVRMGMKDMSDLIRPGCEEGVGVNGSEGVVWELLDLRSEGCGYINVWAEEVLSSHHPSPFHINVTASSDPCHTTIDSLNNDRALHHYQYPNARARHLTSRVTRSHCHS
jgi:hypothetical protein